MMPRLHSLYRAALLGALTLVTSFGWLQTAEATPRFAARTGTSCFSCHVNPTGGGLRNDYGREFYAGQQLSIRPPGKDAPPPPVINPSFRVSDAVKLIFGADLRLAGLLSQSVEYVHPDSEQAFKYPELNTLMLMQSDVYLGAELGSHVKLYADWSVLSNSFEAFAMVYGLKGDFYLKAGGFLPPYGLKLPNHRIFIREDGMGISPASRDAAIEVGGRPGPLSFALAIFNGSATGGGTILDTDPYKAVSGRLDVTLNHRKFHLTVGGSMWGNTVGEAEDEAEEVEESRTRTIRFGPYVTAALGPFLVLFELDFEESKDLASDSTTWKRAGYLELSVVPVQGLDIQMSWGHFDPDLDLKPNTVNRVGIGVEVFPVPFLEFKFLYRHSFADVEVGITDARTFPWAASNGMDEVMFFIHAFL